MLIPFCGSEKVRFFRGLSREFKISIATRSLVMVYQHPRTLDEHVKILGPNIDRNDRESLSG